MDKRILHFALVVTLIWMVWIPILNWLYPPKKKPVREAAAVEQLADKLAAEDAPVEPEDSTPAEGAADDAAEVNQTPVEVKPEVPRRDDIVLGTDQVGADAQWPIFARFTNRGAAVSYLQLNRVKNEARTGPLVLLQEESIAEPSFVLELRGKDADNLRSRIWEVEHESDDKVIFATTALGGRLRIEKHFWLDPEKPYMVRMNVVLKNLSRAPIDNLEYTLTGGNGLPIEGKWYNSYYFRDMLVLFDRSNSSGSYLEQQTSQAIANAGSEKPFVYTNLQNPPQFAGIDDQYFASLVIQEENAAEVSRIAKVESQLLTPAKEAQLSNIGVQLTSTPVTLASGGEFTCPYLLFNGPKENSILAMYDDYSLNLLIHYSSFLGLPIGGIAKVMVWILDLFYGWVGDYGLAIILLTVCVRTCMFPLSLKQTQSMVKMQELAPKMEEIKKKYANDKEKLNQAVMELYSRHKVNPLGGCLPMLIQLPIFVGLFQALSHSYSLRQSTFLYGWTWIHDLAAPDQLFAFGFDMPFLGPYFNLLPILAVAQMIVQMRWMSPPATSPEMELQKKMMTFMMIFFGFMFYKMPSGLCVYFITSGTWSMVERKLLPKPNRPVAAPGETPSGTDGASTAAVGDISATSGNAANWKTPVRSRKKGKAKRT